MASDHRRFAAKSLPPVAAVEKPAMPIEASKHACRIFLQLRAAARPLALEPAVDSILTFAGDDGHVVSSWFVALRRYNQLWCVRATLRPIQPGSPGYIGEVDRPIDCRKLLHTLDMELSRSTVSGSIAFASLFQRDACGMLDHCLDAV